MVGRQAQQCIPKRVCTCWCGALVFGKYGDVEACVSSMKAQKSRPAGDSGDVHRVTPGDLQCNSQEAQKKLLGLRRDRRHKPLHQVWHSGWRLPALYQARKDRQ